MYFLVYAIFIYELQKIFFLRDIMDNQCVDIFSTQCNCLWVTQCHVCILLKKRIFFHHVYPRLSFFFFFFLKKLGLCLFIYPHPLYFSPKLFFPKLVLFFLFLQGEKFFFNFCGSQGELLLFIGGVVSIFYRVELFCVPLILYFHLSFIVYVYSLLSCLYQYVTKTRRSR